MTGLFGRAADWLEFGRPSESPVVCRFHGVHCELGMNWPLDRGVVEPADVQMDDLLDLITEGRRKAGLPVAPSPRELWAVGRHEQVPAEELAEREREAAEVLAAAKARNEQILAELEAEAEAGRRVQGGPP